MSLRYIMLAEVNGDKLYCEFMKDELLEHYLLQYLLKKGGCFLNLLVLRSIVGMLFVKLSINVLSLSMP